MGAVNKEEAVKIMQSEPKDRAWYEQHIREAVIEFYAARGVEENEIIKADQNSWVACCTYVQRECINKYDILTTKSHQAAFESVNAVYDGKIVAMLCDIYLDLAFMFNRNPSLYAFSKMVGIHRNTIEGWAKCYKERYGVSCSRSDNEQKQILGTLRDAKGIFLENVIIHGKGGVIGSLAALNHEYGWSSPKQLETEKETAAPELPNYPQFLLENKGE